MATEIKDPRMADHLANERTFLAWIRTSLGIVAFGFVIERFGLVMRQMGLFLGKSGLKNTAMTHGFSELVGIFVIGFGIVISLLAYFNFKKVEKHILKGATTYQPTGSIYAVLIVAILVMGIFLMMYLLQNLTQALSF